jgi:3-dehydrosphinganine reductase
MVINCIIHTQILKVSKIPRMNVATMSSDIEMLPWFHPFTLGILGMFGILSLVLLFLMPSIHTGDKKLHAVITGGSSGIGLGLAHQCAENGVQNITLIARNMTALEKAQKELAVKYPSSKFHIQSLDVGDYKAVSAVGKLIVKNGGPPTMLFNNAGITTVHTFQDVPIEDFEKVVRCNYLGTVYMTKALLNDMPPGSCIMMTSSMAGLVGVFGFTGYSPTKFAIRGFAESLQSEVRRNGISVSLAFPPDTDTPCYEAENKSKPKETFLISDSSGLMQPEA